MATEIVKDSPLKEVDGLHVELTRSLFKMPWSGVYTATPTDIWVIALWPSTLRSILRMKERTDLGPTQPDTPWEEPDVNPPLQFSTKSAVWLNRALRGGFLEGPRKVVAGRPALDLLPYLSGQKPGEKPEIAFPPSQLSSISSDGDKALYRPGTPDRWFKTLHMLTTLTNGGIGVFESDPQEHITAGEVGAILDRHASKTSAQHMAFTELITKRLYIPVSPDHIAFIKAVSDKYGILPEALQDQFGLPLIDKDGAQVTIWELLTQTRIDPISLVELFEQTITPLTNKQKRDACIVAHTIAVGYPDIIPVLIPREGVDLRERQRFRALMLRALYRQAGLDETQAPDEETLVGMVTDEMVHQFETILELDRQTESRYKEELTAIEERIGVPPGTLTFPDISAIELYWALRCLEFQAPPIRQQLEKYLTEHYLYDVATRVERSIREIPIVDRSRFPQLGVEINRFLACVRTCAYVPAFITHILVGNDKQLADLSHLANTGLLDQTSGIISTAYPLPGTISASFRAAEAVIAVNPDPDLTTQTINHYIAAQFFSQRFRGAPLLCQQMLSFLHEFSHSLTMWQPIEADNREVLAYALSSYLFACFYPNLGHLVTVPKELIDFCARTTEQNTTLPARHQVQLSSGQVDTILRIINETQTTPDQLISSLDGAARIAATIKARKARHGRLPPHTVFREKPHRGYPKLDVAAARLAGAFDYQTPAEAIDTLKTTLPSYVSSALEQGISGQIALQTLLSQLPPSTLPEHTRTITAQFNLAALNYWTAHPDLDPQGLTSAVRTAVSERKSGTGSAEAVALAIKALMNHHAREKPL